MDQNKETNRQTKTTHCPCWLKVKTSAQVLSGVSQSGKSSVRKFHFWIQEHFTSPPPPHPPPPSKVSFILLKPLQSFSPPPPLFSSPLQSVSPSPLPIVSTKSQLWDVM